MVGPFNVAGLPNLSRAVAVDKWDCKPLLAPNLRDK